jgi:hypothetical protein
MAAAWAALAALVEGAGGAPNERAPPSVLLPVAAAAAAAGPLIGTIGTRLAVCPMSGGFIVFSLAGCKFTPEGYLEQFKLFRIELNFNKPDLRLLLEAHVNGAHRHRKFNVPTTFIDKGAKLVATFTLTDGNFQPEMVWPHPGSVEFFDLTKSKAVSLGQFLGQSMVGFTGVGNFEKAVQGGGSFAMDRGGAFTMAWRKTYLGEADGANSREEGAADLRISSAGN